MTRFTTTLALALLGCGAPAAPASTAAPSSPAAQEADLTRLHDEEKTAPPMRRSSRPTSTCSADLGTTSGRSPESSSRAASPTRLATSTTRTTARSWRRPTGDAGAVAAVEASAAPAVTVDTRVDAGGAGATSTRRPPW